MVAVAEQGRAAEGSVLVVAAPERAAVLVRGRDRTSWLNGLITSDLAKLAPGQASYSLLVEKKGRIQTDLVVVPSETTLALAVPAELRDAIVSTLDHYLVMEDAELVPADLDFFFAHGPRANELRGAAPYFGTLDLLGKGGAVFAVEKSERARLDAALEKIGAVMGDDAGWEALRIERGLPRFGVEVDTTMYPQEASLEKLAVSFDKGCYLGQEVVYMLENRGHVKKKLVPLDLEGEGAPEKGAKVTAVEGAELGEIKSSAIGPLGGKPVAIAMVKWSHAKPGTEVRVGDRVARVRS